MNAYTKLTVLDIDSKKRVVTLINRGAKTHWEERFQTIGWISRQRYGEDKRMLEHLDRVLRLNHPLTSEMACRNLDEAKAV